MKKYLLFMLVAVVSLMVACGQQTAEEQNNEEMPAEETTNEEMETPEETTAETLWADIQNREEWPLMPGTEEMQEGKSPHGAFLTTYINEPAMEAIDANAEMMPDGAIVAKENYNENEEYVKLTAMAKMDGSWYWLVYGPEGEVMNEGEIQSCIDCHNNAEKDMLFYWKAE
jgi:hypothetical protein